MKVNRNKTTDKAPPKISDINILGIKYKISICELFKEIKE